MERAYIRFPLLFFGALGVALLALSGCELFKKPPSERDVLNGADFDTNGELFAFSPSADVLNGRGSITIFDASGTVHHVFKGEKGTVSKDNGRFGKDDFYYVRHIHGDGKSHRSYLMRCDIGTWECISLLEMAGKIHSIAEMGNGDILFLNSRFTKGEYISGYFSYGFYLLEKEATSPYHLKSEEFVINIGLVVVEGDEIYFSAFSAQPKLLGLPKWEITDDIVRNDYIARLSSDKKGISFFRHDDELVGGKYSISNKYYIGDKIIYHGTRRRGSYIWQTCITDNAPQHRCAFDDPRPTTTPAFANGSVYYAYWDKEKKFPTIIQQPLEE